MVIEVAAGASIGVSSSASEYIRRIDASGMFIFSTCRNVLRVEFLGELVQC